MALFASLAQVLLVGTIASSAAVVERTLWVEHTNLHKSLFGPCFYVGQSCTAQNTICAVIPEIETNIVLKPQYEIKDRIKRAAAADEKTTAARDGYGGGGGSYGGNSYGSSYGEEQPEYKYFDSRTDVTGERKYELPITLNTYSTQKKVVKKQLVNLYRQHEHEHVNTNIIKNIYKINHPHVETEYVTYVQDKYVPNRYIHVSKSETVQDKGVQETPTEETLRKTVELPPEIVPVETVKYGYDGQVLPGNAPAAVERAQLPQQAAPALAAAPAENAAPAARSSSLYIALSPAAAAAAPAVTEQAAPTDMTAINPPTAAARRVLAKRSTIGAAFEEEEPQQLMIIRKVEKVLRPYSLKAVCMCAETFVPALTIDGCECPFGKRVQQATGRCA